MNRERTDRQPGTLPGAAAEHERRPGMRALGLAASRIAGPIVARRGGILARLKAEWPAIIGAELGAITWPDALNRDGVLKLRVARSAGLEVQHRAPLLIERINFYFGRNPITRLVLVQAPLPLALPQAAARAVPLGAAEAQALEHQLTSIADPELRAALFRLGQQVASRSPRRR